jgi:murein DD-endopeptidase MepM/ murein hydrolase activator NlpD
MVALSSAAVYGVLQTEPKGNLPVQILPPPQPSALVKPKTAAAKKPLLVERQGGVAKERHIATAEVRDFPIAAPPEVPLETPSDSGPDTWLEHTVRPGDTLSKIFANMGLKPSLLSRIVSSDEQAKQLSHIKPGQELRIQLDPDGEFLQLVFQKDPATRLKVKSRGERLETRVISKALETRTAHAVGTITDSLFVDGQKAGLSDTKVMELVGLFGWDIDFALEIRSGDSFSVVYQEEYLEGEKFREGAILAAEFVNRGKTYRAVRFEDKEGEAGYYSPDGQSLRKAFLRTPIRFARVSSGFNPGRMHPILKKARAHKGVDYAAPTGTPIRAAGDGKITFRGTKRGYGKTMVLDHGNGISTLYGHMSGYRSGPRVGSRVRQGDVIGYVGMTGLATGPHLHYEFRVNGVHRNPLTVKLPKAQPIDPKLRPEFVAQTQPLLAQLDTLSRTLLADAR